MKRLICAFLIVICCAAWASTALAGVTLDDFFRTQVGRLSFTLPNVPEVVKDWDYSEMDSMLLGVQYIGWTEKYDLYCSLSGEDWLATVADLTPMLNQIRRDYPGRSEVNYQANALMNLAYAEISHSGGEFEAQPEAETVTVDGDEFAVLTFAVKFPNNAPRYIGKGLMDGEKAVLLIGEDSAECRRLFGELKAVSREEAEQSSAPVSQTVSFNGISVTFPGLVDENKGEHTEFYDAFGPQYSYLTMKCLSLSDEEIAEIFQDAVSLMTNMQQFVNTLMENNEISYYTINLIGDDICYCVGWNSLPSYASEGNVWRAMTYLFLARNSLVIFTFPQNETGHAFIDSVRIEGYNNTEDRREWHVDPSDIEMYTMIMDYSR